MTRSGQPVYYYRFAYVGVIVGTEPTEIQAGSLAEELEAITISERGSVHEYPHGEATDLIAFVLSLNYF